MECDDGDCEVYVCWFCGWDEVNLRCFGCVFEGLDGLEIGWYVLYDWLEC